MEIIKPNLRVETRRSEVQKVIDQIIFAALFKHLGELCKFSYVKELKENGDLQKRTIEGQVHYILRDKVILVMEEPDPLAPGDPRTNVEIKYKMY